MGKRECTFSWGTEGPYNLLDVQSLLPDASSSARNFKLKFGKDGLAQGWAKLPPLSARIYVHFKVTSLRLFVVKLPSTQIFSSFAFLCDIFVHLVKTGALDFFFLGDGNYANGVGRH